MTIQEPVTYFNKTATFDDVFFRIKGITKINDTSWSSGEHGTAALIAENGNINVVGENLLKLKVGTTYTKFELYFTLTWKGNWRAAQQHILTNWIHQQVEYARIGTDYFKRISKKGRWGVVKEIKTWKKETISSDYGKDFLQMIPHFDDFTIEPDNINYRQTIDNCYNLYAEPLFKPYNKYVSVQDIPTTINFLKHVFGDQYEMGLKYFKVIYEHPTQILPVLCLASEERQTGKSTMINLLSMMLGGNFVLLNSSDIGSQFNSSYATKNLIAIEETLIDKIQDAEKVKSISTAKEINVNFKHVSSFMIPFYGKIILCTNKVKDFMRIDNEEIRYWIRLLPTIELIDTQIETKLKTELPKFIKYLLQLPPIDFSKSRMVFTKDELKNEFLVNTQKESRSQCHKDIIMYIKDYFNSDESLRTLDAAAIDIFYKWFEHSKYSVSYIKKVLKDEMKLTPIVNEEGKSIRYNPFNAPNSKVGTPYRFNNHNNPPEPPPF